MGQLKSILDISVSVASLKLEKLGCAFEGGTEYRKTIIARERRSLAILSAKKEAKLL